MGRHSGQDHKYFDKIGISNNSKLSKFKCRFCQHALIGNTCRMKHHLATYCPKAPVDTKAMLDGIRNSVHYKGSSLYYKANWETVKQKTKSPVGDSSDYNNMHFANETASSYSSKPAFKCAAAADDEIVLTDTDSSDHDGNVANKTKSAVKKCQMNKSIFGSSLTPIVKNHSSAQTATSASFTASNNDNYKASGEISKPKASSFKQTSVIGAATGISNLILLLHPLVLMTLIRKRQIGCMNSGHMHFMLIHYSSTLRIMFIGKVLLPPPGPHIHRHRQYIVRQRV